MCCFKQPFIGFYYLRRRRVLFLDFCFRGGAGGGGGGGPFCFGFAAGSFTFTFAFAFAAGASVIALGNDGLLGTSTGVTGLSEKTGTTAADPRVRVGFTLLVIFLFGEVDEKVYLESGAGGASPVKLFFLLALRGRGA